jgi:hypothetical protein
MASSTLTALALNCTLTPSPGDSSTEILTDEVLEALRGHGVDGRSLRVVDLDVNPGWRPTWARAMPGRASGRR